MLDRIRPGTRRLKLFPLRAALSRTRCLPPVILLFWAPLPSLPAESRIDGVDVPVATIPLFNGEDLENFYIWIPGTARSDPDQVFSVVHQIDGAPAIRASGQHFGGLVTKRAYADYKLVVEFRWGLVTWDPRRTKAMDSGILLHCTGEDGNADAAFTSPWIRSVEYQMIEGGTGDLILLRGFERTHRDRLATRLTSPVIPGTRNWDPEGTPVEFEGGRINWQHRDPSWRDELGYRGALDVEKPKGDWNLIEIICRNDTLEYFLNGVRVNGGTNSQLTSGRIMFQSEGAEVFFRRIELHPLP